MAVRARSSAADGGHRRHRSSCRPENRCERRDRRGRNDETDTMQTCEQYCQTEPQSWNSQQPQPPRASIHDVDHERGHTTKKCEGDTARYTTDCTTGADVVIRSNNEAVQTLLEHPMNLPCDFSKDDRIRVRTRKMGSMKGSEDIRGHVKFVVCSGGEECSLGAEVGHGELWRGRKPIWRLVVRESRLGLELPLVVAGSILLEPEDEISGGRSAYVIGRTGLFTYRFSGQPSTKRSHSSKSLRPVG